MFYVAKHLDATVGNAHQLSWAYAGFQEVIQELGCPNCNASWGASSFCYVLKAVPCKKCPSDPRYLEKQISKASDKIYLNSQNYSNVNNCRPKENNVGFLYTEKQRGILYEGIFSGILFQYQSLSHIPHTDSAIWFLSVSTPFFLTKELTAFWSPDLAESSGAVTVSLCSAVVGQVRTPVFVSQFPKHKYMHFQ